jgi:hypothetical protein
MACLGHTLSPATESPITWDNIPGSKAAAQPPFGLEYFSFPNSPERENAPLMLTEESNDGNQASISVGNSKRTRLPHLTTLNAPKDHLPSSPAITDNAYRIAAIYRVTQRIRM